MKKVLSVLLVLTMVLCLGLAACSGNKGGDTTTEAPAGNDTTAETPEDTTGAAEIAVVTDVGQLMDKGFNQGTYEGAEAYAKANNISYRYYQPANGSDASDNDRIAAMKQAIDNGAKIIVAPGFLQATAMETVAKENPDVKFVFVDGWALGLDNVTAIVYKEQESGYLAGYAAVKEGYTKLGFTGGGGGSNPAVNRYGYGYAQGANDAAKELGITVDMNYTFLYGETFSASPDLQTLVNGWYTNGTEIVFSCGGSICQSVFAAAAANDKYSIGVDVDQSAQSETVVTSALKGLRESVILALGKFYDGKFDELGGKQTVLGAKEDAVGLPTDSWKLKNFSVDDYNKLFASLKDGSVTIDNDPANLNNEALSNVNWTLVK
jgi:basic membrane protein A